MNNYFISLLATLKSYRASHAGLSPDAIIIGQYAFNKLKEETKLIADSYIWHDNDFENIPMIVDEHESLWRFECVAPLEHIRCCLCGVVLNKNYVGGHNLDNEFVCEDCYSRIKRNLPPVSEFGRKMVNEINEIEKGSMDEDYLDAYGEILFRERTTQS